MLSAGAPERRFIVKCSHAYEDFPLIVLQHKPMWQCDVWCMGDLEQYIMKASSCCSYQWTESHTVFATHNGTGASIPRPLASNLRSHVSNLHCPGVAPCTKHNHWQRHRRCLYPNPTRPQVLSCAHASRTPPHL